MTRDARISRFVFLICFLTITQLAPVITARAHQSHKAHEHGVVYLNIAVEGKKLSIELISPAANIVGFEHHPRTVAQKEALKEARLKLMDGQTIFQLPLGVSGRLIESAVKTDIDDHSGQVATSGDVHKTHDVHASAEAARKDNHRKNEHVHETHSDFTAEYHFICEKPERLSYLDVMLFSIFPAIEKIKVQIITDTTQTTLELTAKKNRVVF